MTETLKMLGQQAPGAATPADLYMVPASRSAVLSSIIICNRSATVASFRISVSVGGGVTATKDYLYYDLPLGSNGTFIATIGLALAAGDIVRVYASTANLSFNATGVERA